jgi:hypothetical protein
MLCSAIIIAEHIHVAFVNFIRSTTTRFMILLNTYHIDFDTLYYSCSRCKNELKWYLLILSFMLSVSCRDLGVGCDFKGTGEMEED